MSTSSPTATLPPVRPATKAATVSDATIGREELLSRANACAEYISSGTYDIKSDRVQPLVFEDNVTHKNRLALVQVFELESAMGSSGNPSRSLICLARVHLAGADPKTDKVWRVWCGDTTLEGQLSRNDHEKRMREVTIGFPTKQQALLTAQLRTAHGSYSRSTAPAAHFWSQYNADPKNMGCKHVRHVLRDLMDRPGEIAGVLDQLEERYQTVILGRSSSPTASSSPATPAGVVPAPIVPVGGAAAAAPTTPATSPAFSASAPPTAAHAPQMIEQRLRTNGPMFREILDVVGPSIHWKQPVLVLGESGYGKTYAARAIGKSGLYDEYYEFPVNPETDGLDFIGGPRRMTEPKADGTGDQVVDRHMDSDVVSAFRAASEGKRVLLLLDEIGNARREVLNAMKNLLNPDGDHYVLKTGRASRVVNGIAKPEEIRAPVCNLAIIATTNIGAGYEANTGDRAVMNRYYKIYYRIDHDEVKQVIQKEVAAKGFSNDSFVHLTRFYSNMQKLIEDDQCERLPNKRDFCRAIRMANDPSHLPKILARLAIEWVGEELDGTPNEDQATSIREAIMSGFAITDKAWQWRP